MVLTRARAALDLISEPYTSVKNDEDRCRSRLLAWFFTTVAILLSCILTVDTILDLLPHHHRRWGLYIIALFIAGQMSRSIYYRQAVRFILYYQVVIFYGTLLVPSWQDSPLADNLIGFLPNAVLWISANGFTACIALVAWEIMTFAGLSCFLMALVCKVNNLPSMLLYEMCLVHLGTAVIAGFLSWFQHTTQAVIRGQSSQLIRARDEAVEASRMKSMFVATVSHEVRTPLNGIMGLSALLEDSALDGEQYDYVRNIRLCGRMLLSLSANILEFARMENDKMQLTPVEFHLLNAVEEVVLVCEIAANEKTEMMCCIDSDVPRYVLADGARMQQLLINLLSNACKYTEEGEIVLSVSVAKPPVSLQSEENNNKTPSNPHQVWLSFVVSDTGVGMNPDQISKLFTPFSQPNSVKKPGVGLGLTISKRIAETMGGTITVSSTPGKGCTFTLTVPVIQCPLPRTERSSSESRLLQPLANRKIGLMSTHAARRSNLARQLGTHGAIITELPETHPHMALGAMTLVDAVVVDLPPIPMLDFLRKVRAHPRLMTSIIITVIGPDDIRLREELERDFGALVIVRPLRSNRLSQMIATAVSPQGALLTPFSYPKGPVDIMARSPLDSSSHSSFDDNQSMSSFASAFATYACISASVSAAVSRRVSMATLPPEARHIVTENINSIAAAVSGTSTPPRDFNRYSTMTSSVSSRKSSVSYNSEHRSSLPTSLPSQQQILQSINPATGTLHATRSMSFSESSLAQVTALLGLSKTNETLKTPDIVLPSPPSPPSVLHRPSIDSVDTVIQCKSGASPTGSPQEVSPQPMNILTVSSGTLQIPSPLSASPRPSASSTPMSLTPVEPLPPFDPPLELLVAEDNTVNQMIIKKMLVKLGHNVDLSVNGRVALNMLQKKRYDLLLTDLHMPELDGYDTVREIRRQEKEIPTRERLPVIAVTASGNEVSDLCTECGMDGFIMKPLNPDYMDKTIRELVKR